ncbi:hypothetical protein Gocc_0182 [Gaiella occulta]|uniref:Thioredoxin domain-containing protein n=1 Tax=Gaiella occulta TaxID=1002870 RepID=A0A7M2Z248_9ACTN|nr:hypothetical protein [Gaiella occulta]RDI75763.1 hypothetical protein Gocc_0182 [Gaiella occulta]
MRPAAALIATGFALVLAGCGTSGGTSAGTSTTTTTTAETSAAPPGTLEALWRGPGEDVAVVPGTSDYGPGVNRVSFLVVDGQSRLVERPAARVWISRGLRRKPYAEATARLERIGVPGGAAADAESIYVVSVRTPAPGTYWLLAEPVGGKRIQALGNVVVKKEAVAPSIGDRAFPSRNPTLAAGVDAKAVTTAQPPDSELLRTTVAAALAAKRPFVVTFATPLYCQTRTCGPVVQVVQSVAKRWRGKGIDFIHVEIYEGNDPARGTNRWVNEWRLPTEPWTFVVDRTGVIRARIEGAFGAGELEAAVEKVAP